LKAVLPILELSIYLNLDSESLSVNEMNELIQNNCVSLCFGLNAFVQCIWYPQEHTYKDIPV